jgi:hypothetical protein
MLLRNRSLIVSTAALACLVVTATPHTASAGQLIVNGSFEADDFGTGGGGQRLGLVGNDVTGWYIPSGDGVYPWGLQNANQYGAGPADTGNQWLILGEINSSTDYTIQQTVNGLTPGNTYTMTFALASEQGSEGAVGELSWLSGSSTATQDFTAPVRGSTYWNPWGHYSETFVATATSATFQMKDLAAEFPGGYDLGLDSFSVLSGGVPEPSTWIMMLLGVGGVGLGLRRRPGAAAIRA